MLEKILEKRVVEKCCREVLEKRVVEMCGAGEDCGREVLEKSVGNTAVKRCLVEKFTFLAFNFC